MDTTINYQGMNDIVYIDLGQDPKYRRNVRRGEASVYVKGGTASLSINTSQSLELIEGGYIYVRLATSQLTGGLFLVFKQKDEAGALRVTMKSKKQLCVYSKQLALYIMKALDIPMRDEQNYSFRVRIGENQAKKDDLRTFRLQKIG